MNLRRTFAIGGSVLLVAALGLAAAAPTASATQNQVNDQPSCSLRVERAEDENGRPSLHWIYNGTNPSKTMWVKVPKPETPSAYDYTLFTHTFYAAGTFDTPEADWVEYPTQGTWISVDTLLRKCPPPTTTTEQVTTTTTAQETTTTTAPEETTTTTEQVTTTTSTPDQIVQFGCPEGQLVRFHFDKVDESAGDFVQFTYIDSFGGTRQFGVVATIFGTFVFTGSGGPSDGLLNTATLVSVDTEGFEFAGFSCYQPTPVDEETTTTVTPTSAAPTTTAPATPFTPAGFAGNVTCPRALIPVGDPDAAPFVDGDGDGFVCDDFNPVAVSPSTAELPFTGSNTRLYVTLAGILGALGAMALVASRTRLARLTGH